MITIRFKYQLQQDTDIYLLLKFVKISKCVLFIFIFRILKFLKVNQFKFILNSIFCTTMFV